MTTLIIYDNNGQIFTQITGDYIKPNGLQHLEVTVAEGKILTGVDVSLTPHQAILVDVPKSDTELLREELENTKLALAELAEITLGGGTV